MTQQKFDWKEQLQQYDVIWTSRSKDQDGSMPIGNGEIGLNVWMNRKGKLYLLIARTDAWDEIGRLCKIGRVCIELSPSLAGLLASSGRFRQRLNLLEGSIEISVISKGIEIDIRIWVDAHHPIVNVEIKATQPIGLSVKNEIWRNQKREITQEEEAFPIARKVPQIVYPDSILTQIDGLQAQQIGWMHENQDSIWDFNLKHQHLEKFTVQAQDPLRHRIFGCIAQGENLKASSSIQLDSVGKQNQFHLQLIPFTKNPSQPGDWIKHGQEILAQIGKEPIDQLWENHKAWWASFWERSWIFASGTPDAEILTRGYILQRWINACAGRGNYPIKFNGTLFTVDSERKYDPDYRRWGPQYWFQNTRLPYWTMLMTGDFDLFQPFIKMYMNAIPLARFRNKVYFNHTGWFMPETMSFWGTYDNRCFGFNQDPSKLGDPIDNRYIRYHYNNTLEFLAMVLEFYRFTQDPKIWDQIILPVAEEVFEWWSQHWPRDADGKLYMNPANSVETYWDCTNPTPDIAGLQWTIDILLTYPEDKVPQTLRIKWSELRKQIPEIPIGKRDGDTLIFPAYEPLPRRTNCENPELYTIFPYSLYGLTKPQLELAQRTFFKRNQYNHVGWSQDEIQAALLGLTDVAKEMIIKRAKAKHKKSRFPAFWGPNFDWIPDQDHGSNLMTAFQRMVAQGVDDKILLLPAWPKEWKVTFKLHLPKKTQITGEYDGEKLSIHEIKPPVRQKDIIQ